jgi:hypothetical protein
MSRDRYPASTTWDHKGLCPSTKKEKLEEAKEPWENKHGLKDVENRVEFLSCDLSDMTVVKRVAD